jgi:hypothetical protein
MSSSKKFENKQPLRKRKKELFILIIMGFSFISTIFLYTYILYSPIILLRYPRIDIRTSSEPNYDEFVNCTFELSRNDFSENIEITNSRIKIRGSNTNWNEKAPKKGYRLELSQRVSLLGMRTDDDWLLMAMYYDSPRMRIKLSFEFWRRLDETNPTANLPESEYVSLYINNEFQGLYLLAERNDRRLFNLDDAVNDIDSSLIFQAKGYTELKYYDRDQWEQDWPNEGENIFIMDEIMIELIYFINNTSDEIFFDHETGIYSKFDKLNLIDFYLFNFFILHLDFWHGNYFLIRNINPAKFYLIPWDFDFSFGQFGGSFYNPENNPDEEIKKVNRLYDRLLDNVEFIQCCKERWKYLRGEVWNDNYILEAISTIYREIKEIIQYESKMWDPVFIKKGWKNNMENSIEYLFEWIPKRLNYCDLYFSQEIDSTTN